MHLTANVLCITNPNKLSEKQIYNLYLKNYEIVEGIMCNNGDCLIVTTLTKSQLQTVNDPLEILTNIEYTQDNVKFLCEKIFLISKQFNNYNNCE
jgi:Protein of unknown function (DUF1623)